MTEGQVVGGDSLVLRYVDFVRLPHTVFALPFAFLGVVLASFEQPVSLQTGLLVLVAFTAARFAAMGFNRIADRHLDALNPRTRDRELPAGRLTLGQAWGGVVVASGVFVLSAGLLNGLCLALSPVALAWVLAYSYTKRVTSWTHLWLGASLAIAPVGGYLAVTGRWSDPAWILPAIAAAVLTWVAGFDIFYALQDQAFDREHELRSAVVLLGEPGSIMLAKLLHGITLALLIVFGVGTAFGALYYLGVGVAAVLLAWEHRLVQPGRLERLNAAFFTMNGIISMVVLGFAVGDRIL